MALTPMQYKSYVWPHNPRTYRITYQRQVAVQKVPFGRYALQNLGMTRRVMEGEGEFFGSEAYDEFRKLASVFYQEGPGMLIHPVWQSATSIFWGGHRPRGRSRTKGGTRLAFWGMRTGTARSWYRWGRRKRQALSRSLRHQVLREMAARLPGRSIIP